MGSSLAYLKINAMKGMFKSQAAGECIKNILGAFVALILEKEEKKNGEKEKKKKKL